MEVELLLSCGHIIVVPVESIVSVPQKGAEVVCSICKSTSKIKRVGTPYRVERTIVDNSGSSSMLEKK